MKQKLKQFWNSGAYKVQIDTEASKLSVMEARPF